jgi:hypothetical protein
MYLEAVDRGLLDKHSVQPLQRWITNGVIYCERERGCAAYFCAARPEPLCRRSFKLQ